MATTTLNEGRGESTFLRSVNWGKAVQAGLIVGAILYLVSRGIPWVGSSMIQPTIMGREMAPSDEATGSIFFGYLIVHLVVSVIYGLIIAPIVNGFKPITAGLIGGVVGIILYFLNYAAFGLLFESVPGQREWIAFAIHLAFGVITAETYKGLSRNRVAGAV